MQCDPRHAGGSLGNGSVGVPGDCIASGYCEWYMHSAYKTTGNPSHPFLLVLLLINYVLDLEVQKRGFSLLCQAIEAMEPRRAAGAWRTSPDHLPPLARCIPRGRFEWVQFGACQWCRPGPQMVCIGCGPNKCKRKCKCKRSSSAQPSFFMCARAPAGVVSADPAAPIADRHAHVETAPIEGQAERVRETLTATTLSNN